MPEGDTVFRVAKGLRRALLGETLTRGTIRTERWAHLDLAGEQVREVDTYGKHLLIRFADTTLRSHLRMEGVWHVYAPGARWRRPAHQARIVLETSRQSAVGFMLADIDLVPTVKESELLSRLGPDVLKPDWFEGGFERANQNLKQDRRPVHVAILDQANVAGFGNEYANELCFLRGVNPWDPASDTDTSALLELGRRLIVANLDKVARVTTGVDRAGQRLHVYGRAGRPCGRCGTPIRFGRVGANISMERHVYWCPNCQPRQVESGD